MNSKLGAHEVMQIHEVLTDAIDGINQFELYAPHVKDPELGSILNKQTQFIMQEYDSMIQSINQQGLKESIPYRAPKNTKPIYGLRNPQPQNPNLSQNQLDDRDIASGMLGCLKSSTILKTMASLECANPNLRIMLQQGAVNCNEMAYEVWQYMNSKGYYQVPTLKDTTTNTMLSSYSHMGSQGTTQQSPRFSF